MEQVLQESAKVGHVSNLEWLEQLKIDPKETMTFQSGEQNELDEVIKILNQKLYNLPKIIHQTCDTLRPNQKLHGNQFGTLWK
jgi:hypothetical protein